MEVHSCNPSMGKAERSQIHNLGQLKLNGQLLSVSFLKKEKEGANDLYGKLVLFFVILGVFVLLLNSSCAGILAWGNLLFFDASLRLIEPLDFTFSKSNLSMKSRGSFYCHICCAPFLACGQV